MGHRQSLKRIAAAEATCSEVFCCWGSKGQLENELDRSYKVRIRAPDASTAPISVGVLGKLLRMRDLSALLPAFVSALERHWMASFIMYRVLVPTLPLNWLDRRVWLQTMLIA